VECTIDRQTDVTTVGLDEARVEPGLKQLLEYNVRQIRWNAWYRRKPQWLHRWRWMILPFWLVSDYGRSTVRIIVVFLFLRSLYFSVVTVTTLGFGDIAANPTDPAGHVLLMVQVILGYVLLGAIVTRLAVLFTTGGPAANHLMQREWSMPKELADRLRAISTERVTRT